MNRTVSVIPPQHQPTLFNSHMEGLEIKKIVKERFRPKMLFHHSYRSEGDSSFASITQRAVKNESSDSKPSFIESHSKMPFCGKPVVLPRKTLLPKKVGENKLLKCNFVLMQ